MVNICKGKKKLEGRKPKCWQCYLWDVHLQLVFSFHFCLNLGLSYDKHVFLLSEDTGFWWLGFLFFFFFKTIHDTAISKRQLQVHFWSVHPRPVLLNYMGTPQNFF